MNPQPTISKTDYMRYLECPLYGWLAKHKPELMKTEGESLNQKFGNEAEELAHGLFPKGAEVKTYYKKGSEETKTLMEKGESVIYQAQAMTDKFQARSDILIKKEDGWHLYEVKSATKVKPEYLNDLGFQVNAFKLAGIDLKSVNLIHVNNQYVFDEKKGIEIEKLFVIKDMTDQIMERLDEELDEMEKAYKILTSDEIPMPDEPRKNFPYDLTPLMKKEYYSHFPEKVIEKGVSMDKEAIRAELESFEFPLYFFDYETLSTAIPLFNGTRPWQQVPMQYSLHVLNAPDGKLTHFEYLHTDKTSPFQIIAKNLREQIGDKGTVLAWHSSFEIGRNKEIAEMAPKYRDFMLGINERMYDPKNIFKKYYKDNEFRGSFSLKAVLPVLLPEYAYDDLEIRKGGDASVGIYDLVFNNAGNKDQLKKHLLDYCERDTLVMVKLYEFLKTIS